MGKTLSRKIDDGTMTFTFVNNEGEVFSSFRINPADITLMQRCEEVGEKLQAIEISEASTAKDLKELNDQITEQINYLLGYEASETLFVPPMTAVTVLPDGRLFALVVMEQITELVGPELKKRQKKMAEAVEKYTAKYEN